MNDTINQIANAKRLAVVGVSDKSFGGEIYKTLKKRGYTVYPVHPTRTTFHGDPCFASLRELPPGITAAILAVSPQAAEQVVDDAISAGITHLWFQQGKDFSGTVAKAQAKGLQTVSRKCILLYAQPVTGIHSIHHFLARSFGRL
jgi:hypothetical protein